MAQSTTVAMRRRAERRAEAERVVGYSPTKQGKVRVAIYLRVSTKKQLKGNGLKDQEKKSRQRLDAEFGPDGYTATVYTDGGISGKLRYREDIDRLNDDIFAKQLDVVMLGELDRVGRTSVDINRWVVNALDNGIRVITADGLMDSNSEYFHAMLGMMSYLAQVEHKLILDRTTGGRERKLEAGGWPNGEPPFGVMLEGRGRDAKPVENPKEVLVWEKMAELIVDDRKNAEECARGLNGLELLTRDGKEWTGSNVIQRVHSTVLDGYVLYRNPDRSGKWAARRDESGEFLYGETVKIPVPAPLPAERVTAMRNALRRRSWIKSGEKEYLLSTRIFGMCGNHYTGTYREERARTTYRCSGKERPGQEKCSCQEILVDEMESAVWAEIRKLLVNKAKLRELAAEWLGTIPAQLDVYQRRISDLEELAAGKRKLREKIREKQLLLEINGDPEDDAELLTGMRERYAEEEVELREQIGEAQSWLAEAEAQQGRVDSIMTVVDDLDPELDRLSFDQQLDLMELLDIRVEITSTVPGQVRSAGCPFETWLTESKRLVPAPLTDEQWERISHVIPAPKKTGRAVDPRQVFEGALYKLRHGITWKQLPEGTFPRWHTVYQRALAWFNDGHWTAAVEALGDYQGTPVPPLYVLPDFKLTASFDPRLSQPEEDQDGVDTCEGVPEQASRILLAWVTTRIESELAA